MMQSSRGGERRAGLLGCVLEKRDLIAGEFLIGLVAGGVGMACARLLLASTFKALGAGFRRWAAGAASPVKDAGL